MNIERFMNLFGRSVFIMGKDAWHTEVFNAFIQPLRYKNKLYLEESHTPIGVTTHDAYLYLGPPKHDLTKLDDSYRIVDNENNSYIIDRAEKIFVGDKVQYIWAVIRMRKENR